MERAYWTTMVRGEAISRFNSASLTSGQLVWIKLNQWIDDDEFLGSICGECKDKRNNPMMKTCRSCGKDFLSMDTERSSIPEHLQREIAEAAAMARGEG